MQVLSGFLRQVARAERLSSYSPRASFAKHFTRATLISINVLVRIKRLDLQSISLLIDASDHSYASVGDFIMSDKRKIRLLSEKEVAAKLERDGLRTKVSDSVSISCPLKLKRSVKPGLGALNTNYGPKLPVSIGPGIYIKTFYIHHHDNFHRHVHVSGDQILQVTRVFKAPRGEFPPRSPHVFMKPTILNAGL